MLDPLAQQIGIGGIFALLVIGAVLKWLPPMLAAMRGNGARNAKQEKAGEKDPSYWTGEFSRIVKAELLANTPIRNEDIRRIVREELGRFDSGQERIIEEIRRMK